MTDLGMPLTSEDIARLERSYITQELARDADLFQLTVQKEGDLLAVMVRETIRYRVPLYVAGRAKRT